MSILASENFPKTLPDHTQLPCEDGTFVKNFQEHPQSILLTDSLKPVLDKLHPDGQYCIGQDSGIYWKLDDPPEKGAVAPDWFYVGNVPPDLDGKARRSYVLWKEYIAPTIVIEFVSGDGKEERDKTPWKGKFWIYETVIRPTYYAIYEVELAKVEVYIFNGGSYQLITPNERGHYPILPMGVELGIWQGNYQNYNLPWLRWWDEEGNLLLTGEERESQVKILLEREKLVLQEERQAKLQALQQAEIALQEAEAEKQAKLQARQEAEAEKQAKLQALQEAERLKALLRERGINFD